MTFAFEWPLCGIFFFLLPWIVKLRREEERNNNASALKVPFFREIEGLSSARSFLSGKTGASLLSFILALSFACLVTAAMRPVKEGALIPLQNESRNLVLVIDISESMLEEDFILNSRRMSRISAVRNTVRDFLEKRSGDRISIVLFGTKAYTYIPLTSDVKTAREMFAEIYPGMAGPYTALGDGLMLGLKEVESLPADKKLVILLSDGASNAGDIPPAKAAEIAEKLKTKVYTIAAVPDKAAASLFGLSIVTSPDNFDEETLQKIAEKTGGKYYRAKDVKRLQEIYAAIDALEPMPETKFTRPKIDFFHIPLSAAALLLALFFILKSFAGSKPEGTHV